MLIGAHVSAAGGVEEAPKRAHDEKLECFQFFSRSPRGGKPKPITPETVQNFQAGLKKYNIKNTYIHTPYYINFASTNNRIRYGSISVVREELERASQLGVRAVMTHLGSSKDMGRSAAIPKVVEGIKKVLAGYKGSAKFLIENSAGAGDVIGSTFEEIGGILKAVGHKNTGICLDTQHSFASGYDWRDPAKGDAALKELDKHIGLKNIICMHGNDSKIEYNGHKDRHEHIGKGHIGVKGFEWIINHPKLQHIDLILETETDERENDVAILKKIRRK